jgi:hypothetical protein
MRAVIALTFDIDWADDRVLAHTLELLAQYQVKATFFCTHKVPLGDHEYALHPNYDNPVDRERVIAELKEIFPEAHGVRSHRMDFALGRDISIYEKYGISYDSNYAMPGAAHIAPFHLMNDLVEIPFYFGDGFLIHDSVDNAGRFDLDTWLRDEDGLKVFAFHPIHIYLNTNSGELYQQCRPYFKNSQKLWSMRNPDPGVATLFGELLRYIHTNQTPTATLAKIEAAYRHDREVSLSPFGYEAVGSKIP